MGLWGTFHFKFRTGLSRDDPDNSAGNCINHLEGQGDLVGRFIMG